MGHGNLLFYGSFLLTDAWLQVNRFCPRADAAACNAVLFCWAHAVRTRHVSPRHFGWKREYTHVLGDVDM